MYVFGNINSIVPIVWKIKYYIKWRRTGTSYVKQNREKANWNFHFLHRNCLLKNRLLKERQKRREDEEEDFSK